MSPKIIGCETCGGYRLTRAHAERDMCNHRQEQAR